MPRFRARLDTDTIYTDGESAFITPDTVGGYWGEGNDPLSNLQDEHGDDTPVEEVSPKFMRAISNNYNEPEGYDPDDE